MTRARLPFRSWPCKDRPPCRRRSPDRSGKMKVQAAAPVSVTSRRRMFEPSSSAPMSSVLAIHGFPCSSRMPAIEQAGPAPTASGSSGKPRPWQGRCLRRCFHFRDQFGKQMLDLAQGRAHIGLQHALSCITAEDLADQRGGCCPCCRPRSYGLPRVVTANMLRPLQGTGIESRCSSAPLPYPLSSPLATYRSLPSHAMRVTAPANVRAP